MRNHYKKKEDLNEEESKNMEKINYTKINHK